MLRDSGAVMVRFGEFQSGIAFARQRGLGAVVGSGVISICGFKGLKVLQSILKSKKRLLSP